MVLTEENFALDDSKNVGNLLVFKAFEEVLSEI